MRKAVWAVTAMLAMGACKFVPAQSSAKPEVSTTPQVMSFEKLTEQGRELVKKAQAGNGSAGVQVLTLKDFFMSLNGRSRPGGGEFHRKWNDILIVLDGECTEMTGGTIVEPKEADGGEIRGSRLEGATPHILRRGDFIAIPASTPHQQIVAPGQTVVVLAVKIPAGAGGMAALSPDSLGVLSALLAANKSTGDSR